MVRALVIIALLAGIAQATSYAPVEAHDEGSPNGAFTLHVDPKGKMLTVRTGATTLWQVAHDLGSEQFFLANDGKTLAIVRWSFVQVEDLDRAAIELWNAGGRFAVYSVRELIAQPPRIRGPGPIGGFWRDWLLTADADGSSVFVTTTGLYAYTVDLSTGAIDRRLSPRGAFVWCLGFAALALAFVIAAWARRAKRTHEHAVDRRRIVLAALAPIGGLVWVWLDLTGVPFVPAEFVDQVRAVIFVLALLIVPFSILGALKLPLGERGLRIGLAVATAVTLLGIRIGC